MMRSSSLFFLLAILAETAYGSIFLPGTSKARSLADLGLRSPSPSDASFHRGRNLDRAVQKRRSSGGGTFGRHPLAMAIPGNGVAEQIMVGGFGNFIGIYNTVITVRILLSWFPQAQGVGALQPVFQITDPYLNLFRGIIPPIFGLDLSPILAFVTLDLLRSSTATLAAEVTPEMKQRWEQSKGKFGVAIRKGRGKIIADGN
ncbi:hypothetical protein ACHAWF_009950 [Thalassiosira exigua]